MGSLDPLLSCSISDSSVGVGAWTAVFSAAGARLLAFFLLLLALAKLAFFLPGLAKLAFFLLLAMLIEILVSWVARYNALVCLKAALPPPECDL